MSAKRVELEALNPNSETHKLWQETDMHATEERVEHAHEEAKSFPMENEVSHVQFGGHRIVTKWWCPVAV